jgi:hypothetical protein
MRRFDDKAWLFEDKRVQIYVLEKEFLMEEFSSRAPAMPSFSGRASSGEMVAWAS